MNLDEIRSRINPQYADCIGTESYERKWLCDRIEELERQLAEIKQVIDLSNDMRLRLLNEALKNLIAKDAQIALLREALEGAYDYVEEAINRHMQEYGENYRKNRLDYMQGVKSAMDAAVAATQGEK